MMRGLTAACTRSSGVLYHPVELSLKEWISVIGVRRKVVALNLPLACDKAIQQRDTNGTPNVTNKVADAGDLVEFLAWYSHVVKRTDGNENERNANDLDDAESNDTAKAHAEINVRNVE